jgi:hypothetical protein
VAWVQPVQVARKTALAAAGIWTVVAAMGVLVLARRHG